MNTGIFLPKAQNYSAKAIYFIQDVSAVQPIHLNDVYNNTTAMKQ